MFKKKHGHRGTHYKDRSPTYNTWRAMRARCLQESHEMFQYYGGRGVKVYESWNAFENFVKDMGERPHGMTLDRINPEGHYEPGNCRWATKEEQARNKRKSR
jgi:hypothetical protein